jgi:predicted DNA binding CopG/RHH family protein
MASKKKLSPEEFEMILERIKAAADQPFPDMNFDIDALDVDFDDLCAWSPATPVKSSTTDTPAASLSGTKSICIRVPARVIHAFKVEAAKTGGSYQTIMNRALSGAAAGFV